MVEISDSVRLLFESQIEDSSGEYTVTIPKALVEDGSIDAESAYRVALLEAPAAEQASEAESDATESTAKTASRAARSQGPPVEEGEVRSVTIDTLGDQGDGIAKVERGFIVIVPGTQPGDQVDVEITDVKESVAFAEPVSEATVR